jgi:hypothetical protein
MSLTLDQLRNAFNSKTSSGENSDWKKFFPFWKMDNETQVVVRFLPDLDEDNPLGFLVENLTHELIINGEKKKVPCLTMYGESCPICELSRRYYDEGNDEMGKKYYKKKSYIGQVLVIECPFEYDHEPLVKLIEIGPKIFKQIQSAFSSGDLESIPYNLKDGYNFRIKKTQSGKWADYGTSSFAPKRSDISDDVIDSIELYNLSDYRTKYVDRPTLEAMLLADQTGSNFEEETSDDTKNNNTTQNTLNNENEKNEGDDTTTSKPVISSKAQAVLERLRNKNLAKNN